MSKLSLNQTHTKSIEEVRVIVDKLTVHLKNELGMDCNWEGEDQVRFSRRGVDGTLNISANDVAIDMRLGVMMGAFKSRIKSELQRTMKQYLA